MVLHCGEAIIDMIPNTSGALVPVSGGSQLNTAISLSRLGSKAGFAGSISQDRFGTQAVERAEREGVDMSYTLRVTEPSALAVVQVGDQGEVAYSFYFEGTSLFAFRAEKVSSFDDTVWCLLYGSLAYYVEPLASEMQKLVHRTNKNPLLRAFDVNIRPSVISNKSYVQKRLIDGIAECDILKCTEEELEFLFPSLSEDKIIESCLDRGVSLICLTRGPRGASLYTPRNSVDRPGKSVEVADTVGAGDSFHAAVLHMLDLREVRTQADLQALPRTTLDEITEYGITVSAITCTRKGADSPHSEEIHL